MKAGALWAAKRYKKAVYWGEKVKASGEKTYWGEKVKATGEKEDAMLWGEERYKRQGAPNDLFPGLSQEREGVPD